MLTRHGLTVLGLATACIQADARPQRVAEVSEISISHTGCLGPCPVLDITMRRDGSAAYRGISWTPIIGAYRATIDSETFTRLVRVILQNGFSQFDTAYVASMTDMASTITCLQIRSQRRCIDRYGPIGPPRLRYIEQAIDSVASRLRWEAVVQP